MKVLIGVDPHKSSHTAVAIDGDEVALGQLKVRASKKQCEQLLEWAGCFPDRRWAIESAGGLGYLLAQQLIASGEDVVDVPPTLSARVRVLGSGRSQKNDPNDALSTAIAALRNRRLHPVVADDHVVILRMLADRHHDLTRLRTQAVCRLHAQLANLVPGGLSGVLSASRAATMLASVRPIDGVGGFDTGRTSDSGERSATRPVSRRRLSQTVPNQGLQDVGQGGPEILVGVGSGEPGSRPSGEPTPPRARS
jgi:transposase